MATTQEGKDPIKDLYTDISSDKSTAHLFRDEADFRVQLQANPQAIFSDIGTRWFKDFSQFETDLGLKKKDLRSEATSLASGSALETAETSALPSASPSGSQSNQLAENQKILDQAIGGLTPAGNIPKPGEQTIADISQVPASQLTLPKKIEPTSDGEDLINSLGRGSANLGRMLAETPAFIYDLAALPQNTIAKYTGLPIAANSQDFAEQVGLPENEVAAYYDNAVKASQEKINAKYDKPVSEYLGSGNWDEMSKGFKLLGNQIMESTAISIPLAMGNASGLTPVQSILGGGAVFGAGKKAELDETNPDMSETAKMNNAMSTGLFEGIFEQFGITKLGGAVKDILAKEGKDIAKDLAEKGFKETYAPIFKKYLGVSFEESLSEAATQFSQNAVDKYSGAKPDLDLRDGLVDAAIIGFGAGSTFSAAPTAIEVVKTKKGLAEAARITQEKATLQQDLASPNIADAAKQTISNRLGELNQEEADLAVEEKTKYSALPAELKSEVDNLVKTSADIQQSLDAPNLSEDGKKLLEKELDTNEKRVDEIYAQVEADAKKSAAVDETVGTPDSDFTPVSAEIAPSETPTVSENVADSKEILPTENIEGAAPVTQITEQTDAIDLQPTGETTQQQSVQPTATDDVQLATGGEASARGVSETKITFDGATPKEQFIPQIEQRAKELEIDLPSEQSEAVYESVQQKIAANPDVNIAAVVDETIAEYKAPVQLPTKQESIAAISAKIDMPDADFMPELKQMANIYKAEGVDNPVEFAESVRAEIPSLPASVTGKMLNEAFAGSDADLVESKSRKIFDNATKGISEDVKRGVTTKYKPRSISESENRANDLWSAIESDTPDLDEAVNEAEYHIEKGSTGLDGVDLPVFAINIAKKLDELRNKEGNTLEQINAYDQRAIQIHNLVTRQLTEGGQMTSIGGKYRKEALMAYPAGIVSMVQMDLDRANESKYGKLPEKSVTEISDFLNDLNQSEQGKEAIAQFMEKYTGSKRKADVKKKYAKKKDIWKDVTMDWIDTNLPKDPRKRGSLNASLPGAFLLRPAFIAIQKAVSLGLTVAEAVEIGMVEIRRQYKNAFDTGELPTAEFDETATKAYLSDVMDKLSQEVERIEKLTPEQRAELAKEKEAAKKIKIEEQVKAKLNAEAEAKKQKALDALAKFEEAKAAREKSEQAEAQLAAEEKAAKSDEKERIDRRRKDILKALSDARKAEMQADLARRRAERDYQKFQEKLAKLKGAELGKFTYELLMKLPNGKITEQMVNDAFYKLQGGTTFSEKQLEKIKSLAITITDINKQIPDVWSGKSDAAQNAEFKRKVFKAQRARQQIMYEMKRPGFLDLIPYAITGNLMTVMSVIGGGTVSNAIQNVVSWPRDYVANGFDYLLAKLPGMAQGKKNFFPSKEAIKSKGLGYVVGGEAGLKELLSGPTDDNTEWSNQYNPKPWEAIKRMAEDWNDNTTKLTKAYRLSLDAYEATTFAPTAIFRALNLGDKPFRESATMFNEQNIADELGIPIQQFQTADEFKDYREIASELGSKETFQGRDILQRTSSVLRVEKPIDNWFQANSGKIVAIAMKMIAPFKKTPLNALEEMVKYGKWEFAFISFMGNMGLSYSEKNPAKRMLYRKLAARDAAILTLSLSTRYLLVGMIEAGMIGFTGDDEPKESAETKKNRLTFEGYPKRMVINWATGKRSYPINWMGSQGMAWALMYQDYVNETEEDREMIEQLFAAGWDVLQVSREQTFLANVNQALKATEDGEKLEQWMMRTYGVNSTRVLLPATGNQLTAMGDSQKAQRLTKDESLMTQLYNEAFRKNLGWVSSASDAIGLGKIKPLDIEELPVVYNLWGEPVKTKDEGEVDVFNYLFDFTQGENYKLSSVPQKQLFLNFAETKNPAWLLPVADKKFTLSKGEDWKFAVELTPQWQNEYQKYLGETMKSKLAEKMEKLKEMNPPQELTLKSYETTKRLATQEAKLRFHDENREELNALKNAAGSGALKKPYVAPIMR